MSNFSNDPNNTAGPANSQPAAEPKVQNLGNVLIVGENLSGAMSGNVVSDPSEQIAMSLTDVVDGNRTIIQVGGDEASSSAAQIMREYEYAEARQAQLLNPEGELKRAQDEHEWRRWEIQKMGLQHSLEANEQFRQLRETQAALEQQAHVAELHEAAGILEERVNTLQIGQRRRTRGY